MPYSFSRLSGKDFRHAVIRAEPEIFEELIQFLEDDPRTFGSGYQKEIIWKYIKRYELEPSHITRLENAALKYLFRPMSREFKPMCQTMARFATNNFWQTVHSHLDSETPYTQINAYCLYAYSEGLIAGEKQRLELKNSKRSWPRKYSYGDEVANLLASIQNPQNWPDGIVIYKEPNPVDLPIIYFNTRYDYDFASLDVAAGHKENILTQLDNALLIGYPPIYTHEAFLYAIYLLRQIDDQRAVPILIRFLHQIDFMFESLKQCKLESTTLKVLHYYQTPEALAAIEAHKEADQLYSKHLDKIDRGWIFSYPQTNQAAE